MKRNIRSYNLAKCMVVASERAYYIENRLKQKSSRHDVCFNHKKLNKRNKVEAR